ncbi:hypothetical protein F5Y14DRAFT_448096 [Nemania sp. NC0429]|nr:hypothetical protein F5Y14DRAFT_448096 [Nemania sp. NC0429]
MNVLITGASGLVGSAVVQQAILDTRVNHIFILALDSLDSYLAGHSKITILNYDDINVPKLDGHPWPLAGVEACIWSQDILCHYPKTDRTGVASMYSPLCLLKFLAFRLLPKLPATKTLRFVFVSGEPAKLDLRNHLRRTHSSAYLLRQAEMRLFQIADMNDKLRIVIPRPRGIIPNKAGRFKATVLSKVLGYMDVDHLAQALISLALGGSQQRTVNAEELMNM